MAEPTTTNDWCQTLGITPPKLEAVAGHREANTFTLLLVALLERGEPMTLADVAARFEEAGIAERSRALLSLQHCKPGRPPVYREGDLYHLDPHDDDLDLWVVGHPPAGEVGAELDGLRVRGRAIVLLATRQSREGAAVMGGQAELPEVALLPAEALLNRLVELREGRGGAEQEAPPDPRLDLLQGDFEFVVLRHRSIQSCSGLGGLAGTVQRQAVGSTRRRRTR